MIPEVVGALAIKIYWKTIFWCHLMPFDAISCHFVPFRATLCHFAYCKENICYYSQQEENFNIDHIW